MAIDPREVVSEISRRVHDAATDPPPVLRRSPEPPPRLDPMQSSDAVTGVHQQWAQIHTANPTGGPAAPPATALSPGGVRAKVRARVVTAASEVARTAQQEDRALIGNLIRAVDALARRTDELATRTSDLEALVQEVVHVVSEDLVRLRATLGAVRHDATAGGGDAAAGARRLDA
jgi:hypothetical protein